MLQLDLFKPISRDQRQLLCKKTWYKNKGCGTIEASTGFGKTRIALNCLSDLNAKRPGMRFLVVVPTETLKNQWEGLLQERNLLFNSEVQIINTVVKHNWKCDILVLDEIHRYAAPLMSQVFEKVNYKYILGLTATFERLDNKHELIAKYCPIIDTITTEEALNNGWVSQFKEYIVLLDVPDIETYNEYNKSFYEHFEFFGYDFGLIMSFTGPKGYLNRLAYRDRICRPNASEIEKSDTLKSIIIHTMGFMRALQARKKFINNHPMKIEIAEEIIEARSDRKIITFSNNVKMAENISYGEVYTGKVSKKKGRTTIEEFNNTAVGVLNTCQKCNEGADIKGLSVAIHLGIDSSKTKAVQKRGRIIRFEPGKVAENFILVLQGTVEEKWAQNAYGTKVPRINIEELRKILNGEEVDISFKPLTDLMFRI